MLSGVYVFHRDREARRIQPDRAARHDARVDPLPVLPPPVMDGARPVGPENQVMADGWQTEIRLQLAGQVAAAGAGGQNLHQHHRIGYGDRVSRQPRTAMHGDVGFEVVSSTSTVIPSG